MISDFHVHTHHSGDCDTPMEDMIKTAIDKNIEILCFTEHHDLDFPHKTINFELDFDAYFKEYFSLKEKYADDIQLNLGIELGMQPHLHSTLRTIATENPFDFILASNHLANRIDPYEKEYFENRTRLKGYHMYFEDMLCNLKNYTDYDVYGHLDYVTRYGDFEDKRLVYTDFTDLLDEILKTIIHNGKGIEVNTSGYKIGLNNPHPNREILARYKELGGELITLGSDSHSTDRLLKDFTMAKELLQSLGYKYHATFTKREATYHLL